MYFIETMYEYDDYYLLQLENNNSHHLHKRDIEYDENNYDDADLLGADEINLDSLATLYANMGNDTTTSTPFTNLSNIYSTFSTYLENVTTSMNLTFENSTEYEHFVTSTFDEFLDNVYPPNEEEKMCYETICDEEDDTFSTTPDQFASSSSSSSSTSSTTSAPITTTTTTTTTNVYSDFDSRNSTQMYAFNSSDLYLMDNSTFHNESLTEFISKMSQSEQLALRKLCWETMFGQEMVKLTVMDLVATITSTIFMDFFRALFVRFFNKFWCWDLEKRYPQVSGREVIFSCNLKFQ